MTRPPLATTIASLLGVLVIHPAFAAQGVQASVHTTTVTTNVQGAADREAVRRHDRSDGIGREAIDECIPHEQVGSDIDETLP